MLGSAPESKIVVVPKLRPVCRGHDYSGSCDAKRESRRKRGTLFAFIKDTLIKQEFYRQPPSLPRLLTGEVSEV